MCLVVRACTQRDDIIAGRNFWPRNEASTRFLHCEICFSLRGYAAFALGELDNNSTDEARSVITNLMKQFHPDQT
jgi:hypothetical protein